MKLKPFLVMCGLVMVVLPIVGLTWIVMVKGQQHDRARIEVLADLARQQSVFFHEHGRFQDIKILFSDLAVTNKELAGFVDGRFDQSTWWAWCCPMHPTQGRTFFRDRNGKLYSTKRPALTENEIRLGVPDPDVTAVGE